jgi:hypothetical protein
MKQFFVAVALLGMTVLGGCTTDEIQATRTQYEAIVPPDTLYECPAKPARPTEPVTDKKVAEFIVKLDRAHSICSHSLQAIKAFAAQAQLSVEQNQPQ